MAAGTLSKTLLPTVLLAPVAAACTTAGEETDEGADAIASVLDDDRPLVPNGRDEEIAVPASGSILTELAQPELLVRLQKDGYHFASVFGEPRRLSNADLYAESRAYHALADAIVAALDALARENPTATTRVVTGRDRLFDKGWLTSRHATFELVDVVNRIDRKDFGSGAAPGLRRGPPVPGGLHVPATRADRSRRGHLDDAPHEGLLQSDVLHLPDEARRPSSRTPSRRRWRS